MTWDMANARKTLKRQTKSRIDLLQEFSEKECVEGCEGSWRRAAEEILTNNGLSKQGYCSSVYDLLEKGRGKHRNILITGPANCGKTFLMQPLTLIFNCFCNPATNTFAWVGVELAEVIFLNDFRWSANMIPWHDLLLLLEGQVVNFAAPKTHFPKDISLEKDTPVFCTTKVPFVFIQGSGIDEKETEMMAVRWKCFNFHHQIPTNAQREIKSCGTCFAKFILQNKA